MKYLDLTLGAPEEDLACDEALLQRCEDHDSDEILRFWEPGQHFAVLGYSSRVHAEVDLSICRKHQVPVLRRCSGGGTVLQGPGCLNYSLILRIPSRSILQDIAETNTFIMARLKAALEPFVGREIRVEGFTDLAIGRRKFSGNSQYRKRRALLFHGTFLLNLDISLVAKFLPEPPKQPAYRQNRSHVEFLTNLPISADIMKTVLKDSWSADEEFGEVPFDIVKALVKNRYSSEAWNLRL